MDSEEGLEPAWMDASTIDADIPKPPSTWPKRQQNYQPWRVGWEALMLSTNTCDTPRILIASGHASHQ
jgi:hypothetical protein